MRPKKLTAAHTSGDLAELVCSNSLKSMAPQSAPGLLKHDMAHLDSLILRSAYGAQVPAGQALAVDRRKMSDAIKSALEASDRFSLSNDEVDSIPDLATMEAANEYWIIASGPLTSPALSKALGPYCGGAENLYFYDAIAPVIEAESINLDQVFRASRYDKGDADYLNIPLNKDEYNAFIDAVIAAEKMPLHEFESTKYFEACLPIEVMIERGRDTLRFGPMKPVGLTDPKTGRWPYAAIQLRMENREGTMYSMVGFQTKMKWPDQKRVFSMLPGLGESEFFRFGSVHRNTYVQSPKVLNSDLSFKSHPRLFLAGQVTGVEGYSESAAIGLLAGRSAGAKANGRVFPMPPKHSMIGALHHYITQGCLGPYAPMNTNLGLLPTIVKTKGQSKDARKERQCQSARDEFRNYANAELNMSIAADEPTRVSVSVLPDSTCSTASSAP